MGTAVLTIAQYQALQTGLPKYCATTVFTIAGQSYTTPQVVALISSILNLASAVAPAKATWLATTKAIEAADAQDGKTVKAVREVVALMFENAPATLADLAIAPRKSPTPLTVEALAVAKAKAKATRAARGTTSKKQKAKVTGNVAGVTTTLLISPPPVPAATSPAGAAASSGGSTPTAPAGAATGGSTHS